MLRNIILLLFVSAVMLIGCQTTSEEIEIQRRFGEGGIQYGGVFSVNEIEDFGSLYPLNITDVTGHRIVNQVYEGLLKLNQETLELVPGLAESYTVDESGIRYTFKLRRGVYFHDDESFPEGKGREVKAQDVKYSLDRVCKASANNVAWSYLVDRIAGSRDYYDLSLEGNEPKSGVEGIRVIDDYTLELVLEYPFPSMLKILTLPACYVYPPESVERYAENLRIRGVGTGPFRFKTVKEGEVVILERNHNYWGKDELGNQLPFLDAIKYTFIKEKSTELMEFKKGNLDMVFDLPSEEVSRIRNSMESGEPQDYQFQAIPSMVIQYYSFQHKSDLFGDINVRKAFNYAVDRNQLVTYALQSKGYPANAGIVPPCFPDYDTKKIEGFEFNPDKARQYLEKAGYPNGEGFPVLTLQLNYGGSTNVQVAEVIQKMLEETLNINIELTLVPRAQHFERVETGKALFWRDGWSADYADPENFLTLFYGKLVPGSLAEKSYVNSVRYQNEEFDRVFEAAMRETNPERRIELFQKADQIVVNDAAIIPLYYEEGVRLLQDDVSNFPINAMEYRDFSEVHFGTSGSRQQSS